MSSCLCGAQVTAAAPDAARPLRIAFYELRRTLCAIAFALAALSGQAYRRALVVEHTDV